MKLRISLLYILLFVFAAQPVSGQKKKKVSFEDIYRPVYGYVVDTVSNRPVEKVLVYAFDNVDDARLGEKALMQSRNPMKIRLKGDVVEAVTDASGRYMVPARSKGALVFYFKDWKRTELREIDGRTHVHLGKNDDGDTFNLSDYLPEGYEYKPKKKVRKRIPDGVVLDMNFNYYLKSNITDRKVSRLIIERRLTDMETEQILDRAYPVVRDGKEFHRQRKKLVKKGQSRDSLIDIAEKSKPLSDTTFNVRILDKVDTAPWKDRSFRLGYYVTMEHDGGMVQLDTLHMYTNRVSRSLKYLQYSFDPYELERPETAPESRSGRKGPSVRRRLVIQGVYDGNVPKTLMDSTYELTELHLKASAASALTYGQNIAVADSMVSSVMDELKTVFGDKLDSTVRVTKVSEISRDGKGDRVEFRYVFRTANKFSVSSHLALLEKAENDAQLEILCRQAIEESEILEGRPWEYASNLLAALKIREGRADTSLLAPFVDTGLQECDIRLEDPSTGNMVVRNRKEVVANQVIIHMMERDFEAASALSEMLPDEYMFMREIAACMSGREPSDENAVSLIAGSSLRNSIIMDIYTGEIDDDTMDAVECLPQDEAMTWYLKAVAHGVRYENKTYDMQHAEYAGKTVYETVLDCLGRCFEIDGSYVESARMDADVNESALKDVLGVIVL